MEAEPLEVDHTFESSSATKQRCEGHFGIPPAALSRGEAMVTAEDVGHASEEASRRERPRVGLARSRSDRAPFV